MHIPSRLTNTAVPSAEKMRDPTMCELEKDKVKQEE